MLTVVVVPAVDVVVDGDAADVVVVDPVDATVVVDAADDVGWLTEASVAVVAVDDVVVAVTASVTDDDDAADVVVVDVSWRSATVSATSTTDVVTPRSAGVASLEVTVHADTASAAKGTTIIVHPRCAALLIRPLSSLRCISRQQCAIGVTP